MGPVLGKGMWPAADSDGNWLSVESNVESQLLEDVGQQIVVGEVQRRQSVAPQRDTEDDVIRTVEMSPFLRRERDRGDQALLRLRHEVTRQSA